MITVNHFGFIYLQVNKILKRKEIINMVFLEVLFKLL